MLDRLLQILVRWGQLLQGKAHMSQCGTAPRDRMLEWIICGFCLFAYPGINYLMSMASMLGQGAFWFFAWEGLYTY